MKGEGGDTEVSVLRDVTSCGLLHTYRTLGETPVLLTAFKNMST